VGLRVRGSGGAFVFLRDDHGLGGGGNVAFGRVGIAPAPVRSLLDRAHDSAIAVDWTPDLGAQIGSPQWFRGLATCLALLAFAWLLSPGFMPHPIIGAAPAPTSGTQWDETRAQSIAPLAWGATTGRHEAAGDLVTPLAATPERPIIELTATLGDGDDLTDVLERAGVSNRDAEDVAALVAGRVSLDDLKPGTRFDITLGRRASKSVPRPLEQLAFRAAFDLALTIARSDGVLTLTPHPIAVDHTPLRIEGTVGSSIYRSARAAGVPAPLVAAYIKAIATRVSLGSDVTAGATFDMIIDRARAATGETQLGELAFAGLDMGKRAVRLARWSVDGKDQWFDVTGHGSAQQQSGGLPVDGRITSPFGRRFHPILHIWRMHEGVDVAAPYGSPIHATAPGTVVFAGRDAGYGNFIRINIGGGMTTAFGHLSRIGVHVGEHVAAGEVIGNLGSTGLSTGPHVHYEVRRNNVPINPLSAAMTRVAQLSGNALRQFKAHVATLLATRADAAAPQLAQR
jgi:murein DD-endopeptidase MepM/ murein hydrolase activator NlpD